jgi:hypothetical protein
MFREGEDFQLDLLIRYVKQDVKCQICQMSWGMYLASVNGALSLCPS